MSAPLPGGSAPPALSDADATPAGSPALPPDLLATVRFLKLLTGLLAATMILGLIAIVALLVTRMPAPAPLAGPPAAIPLPEGVRPEAVTFGRGWFAVVTGGGTAIEVYDGATGAPRGRIDLSPP